MKKCNLKDYIPYSQENISKCGVPLDKYEDYCPFPHCICQVNSIIKERKLFSMQKPPLSLEKEIQINNELNLAKN